jgi:hypothetical protein
MIGPSDHGAPVSDWDFEAAEFEPGHRYELIDGRIAVAAEPPPCDDPGTRSCGVCKISIRSALCRSEMA